MEIIFSLFSSKQKPCTIQPMTCRTLHSAATAEEIFEAHVKLKAELEQKLGTDFGRYYNTDELKKKLLQN